MKYLLCIYLTSSTMLLLNVMRHGRNSPLSPVKRQAYSMNFHAGQFMWSCSEAHFFPKTVDQKGLAGLMKRPDGNVCIVWTFQGCVCVCLSTHECLLVSHMMMIMLINLP